MIAMRFAIAAAALLLSTAAPASTCPVHLVTIEPDGSASQGSKDALREAFRAGLPLRVGWSLNFDDDPEPEVTHWSDSGFLTEFEGEIFAQLADIQAQGPRTGTRSIQMPVERKRWSGLVGTNGMLESNFDDGEVAEATRVRSEWCVDSRAACALPSWRLVYLHETNGAPIRGAKSALFDAVRSGYPIRFAWGAAIGTRDEPASVEHAAEPVFISIMSDKELLVQLPEHIAQTSYHDPKQARLGNPAVMWRGMMGTDGSFDAVMVDRATGQETWRMPQRARIAWFAYAPDPLCAGTPLKLATRDGVVRADPPRTAAPAKPTTPGKSAGSYGFVRTATATLE
ncbi:MAG TPA: hypothetical protein VJ303_15565 [Steroidobacteraceae bacterium]|jgi:hypothetical protein|nr:hypothetical protein [Steroidobacteraceae bacterium]